MKIKTTVATLSILSVLSFGAFAAETYQRRSKRKIVKQSDRFQSALSAHRLWI
ncbi:membrane protein [Salmonella enterica subsp. enterica]|uniref:Membrane protein n=1 Tax=Salmonella enterica I TaxID=59201 RepID=A0A447P653_SALET|nr:membrane protein [Salmonella enterica subsp. enterica]